MIVVLKKLFLIFILLLIHIIFSSLRFFSFDF